MIKVELSAELFNAIMNTLAARPYIEVHGLIAAIEAQRVIISDEPQAEEASRDADR